MKVRAPSAAAILSALAILMMPTSTVAAPVAKLTGGVVSPTTGTTTTIFQFSVHFVGSATDEAITVSATVAGSTKPLSLTTGSDERNGTWTGSSTLPAGSWNVTYQSTSTGGTNPTFAPIAVVVTAPTAAPTPTASPTDGGSPSPRRALSVPVEGVVAIGLLGAVAFAAIFGERRRRLAVEAFHAETSGPEAALATGSPPAEGLEDREVDADDETVATIDYETPADFVEPTDGLGGELRDELVDEPPDEPHD